MDKTFAHFLPLASLGGQECDRHYREVHQPFARRMLRAQPQVLGYSTDRVRAERDLAGGWLARPRAFRYIAMRYESGRSLELPPEVRERIVQDHRRCLRELRSFRVREQVLVDRATGRSGLQKLVLELDRPTGVPAPVGEQRLAGWLDGLQRQADDAFGLRRVVVDHVLGEQATAPVDEPGQRPLGHLLPETRRQAFVEVWFDHLDWADEWLDRPAVAGALLDPFWTVLVSAVQEECQLDQRGLT